MRLGTMAMVVSGLMLGATPCLALTFSPAPVVGPRAQLLADPDDALAQRASSLQDSVSETNMRAFGGAPFMGAGQANDSRAVWSGRAWVHQGAPWIDRPSFGASTSDPDRRYPQPN